MEGGWSPAQMWRRVARPRVLVYSAVLLAIGVAFVTSLAMRSPFKADVVRDRASLARLVEDGRIENVYRVQLMNSTEAAQRFHIEVSGLPDAVVTSQADVDVGATQARWVALSVQMPPQAAQALGPGAHVMQVRITLKTGAGDGAVLSEKSTFVVPR
jgi:polyferredoxin